MLRVLESGRRWGWAAAPGRALTFSVYLLATLAAALLWGVLQMPAVGLRALPDGDAVALVDAGGRRLATVPADAPITLSTPTASLSGPATDFVQDHVPERGFAAWYGARSAFVQSLPGPVTLTVPGQPPRTLAPRPRGLTDLSKDVWMLLAGGALVLLMGVWVWRLRPNEWGPRMFATASLGVGICALSGAFYDGREIVADGSWLWPAIVLNYVGATFSAGATLCQFLLFPRRLAPLAIVAPLLTAEVAWGLAGGLGLISGSAYYAGLALHVPALVGAVAWQWRATRGVAGERAILRWVGATTALGTGVLLAGMAAPRLTDAPSLASDGFAFVPLLVVYGGMALAIGRLRLFDLDRWAYRLLLTALAVTAFLAVDAALALVLRLEQSLAFGGAVVVLTAAYLPLRSQLWRRIVGGPRLNQADLFEAAARVAFQPNAEARRADWRRLLADLYDPLQIAAAPPGGDCALSDDRLSLTITAGAGEPALELRHPGGGGRLFGADDLRLALELSGLLARAEAARDSYARGVREERARVARDLHDDVGARLLTSLHRQSAPEMRQDVRHAMEEMRLIFSGLAGDRIVLDQLLADLRHETAERTAAVDVALHWPLPSEDWPPYALPYDAYKALTSCLREVISNSLKHGAPSAITVDLGLEADRLTVRVADDGQGPCAETSAAGRGLGNIRQRLAAIGGDFTFDRATGGAVATFIVPLPPVHGDPNPAPVG